MDACKLNYFDLAKKYSTPYYCYDASQIDNIIKSLLKHFPHPIDIHYSMKANPNIALCERVCQRGLSVEVCSSGELTTAIDAGFSPEAIIAVGPAKKESFLKQLILHNVYLIICESLRELELIEHLALSLSLFSRICGCSEAPLTSLADDIALFKGNLAF